MPSGRCSGCGRTGSTSKIALHIVSCPDYLDLHQTQPAACLSPEAEAARAKTENTPEQRALRRDERLRARFATLDHEVRIQAGRWATPPDLLDT